MKTYLLLSLLFLGGLTIAQDHSTTVVQPNTVFVGADGKFEANPDTALVQFNIASQEGNSHAAYDRASKAAEQIRQVLRSNGADPSAAQMGYFSIEPVYDYTFENVHLPPRVPTPMAKMGAMNVQPAPTEEFSPQTISVTAHVNAMFMLK